ncbi:16S rRNA (guanine(527)-N(7))-methyltransferase RsmG [Salinarimonas chemoclinalis]|uniref:16S rRNA (guanine(527)-N(7))-methyltransferase RsmG n=1 Tax=Salinarimonas chemoclinalis TaxID=3241599 RepID=UPI0035579E74
MPTADSPDAALAPYGVSRETRARLEILVAELRRWQPVKNLVGPRTLDEVWTRHVADSLQLVDLAPPEAGRWVDLGSGAGFPGLVVAIALADRPGFRMDLVEANARKCAFLRHVARLTNAPARVHDARLESVVPGFAGEAEVVSARALAPLDTLVGWSEELLKTGAVGLFPKGAGVESELTTLAKSRTVAVEEIPSRTDSRARVLRIRWLPRDDASRTDRP